jgi:hypothetical protein
MPRDTPPIAMSARPDQDVSVVMCTCNGERFLPEQLASIALQTKLPHELVVCDDQSSDNTLGLLEEFAARAPFPMRIVRNVRRLGSTANFDQAMRLAAGPLIALCDQDDVWQPEKLQQLSAIFAAGATLGAVFTDARLIDDTSKPGGRMLWGSLRFGRSGPGRFRRDPVRVLLQQSVATGATMMIHARVLATFAQIPEGWVHDAWLAWMCVLYPDAAGQIEPVREAYTLYRVHTSQQMGTLPRNLAARLATIRGNDRAVDREGAMRLGGLLRHCAVHPPQQPEMVRRIQEARRFQQFRAALPTSLATRAMSIFSMRGSYLKYARTVMAMGRDLWI